MADQAALLTARRELETELEALRTAQGNGAPKIILIARAIREWRSAHIAE